MQLDHIPTLVLRAPRGPAVAHLLLRIPDGLGRAAVCLLRKESVSFGPKAAAGNCCTLGFSFAGLEAVGMPEGYLGLFRRLAPAFTEGAVRRSVRLGDSAASAPNCWYPEFGQQRAHVVLSWHGDPHWATPRARSFAHSWNEAFAAAGAGMQDPLAGQLFEGARIGHPAHERGQWTHFGFRDGLSDISIDDAEPRPHARDLRRHRPGALLLGEINDAGYNSFPLDRAPDKVRRFFADSSFGILRRLLQDLNAFEDEVDRWVRELAPVYKPEVTRDYVMAKLCGRWPNGRRIGPGDRSACGSFELDFDGDDAGAGCPFGSHVRRMRPAPDRHGFRVERPLQRRGLPFGPACWTNRPTDGHPRGLLAHFFCASIEEQFEHLIGQWSAGTPLGFLPADRAQDPFIGPHDDAGAKLVVPLADRANQAFTGFKPWTTTQGTMYAWHPGRAGLDALLEDDFEPDDSEGPWL